jgi:hypothetical protein
VKRLEIEEQQKSGRIAKKQLVIVNGKGFLKPDLMIEEWRLLGYYAVWLL